MSTIVRAMVLIRMTISRFLLAIVSCSHQPKVDTDTSVSILFPWHRDTGVHLIWFKGDSLRGTISKFWADDWDT